MATDTPRLESMIEKATLAFTAGCCGIVLYLALFPSFYYLTGIALMLLLWAVVLVGLFGSSLVLYLMSRRRQVATPLLWANNRGFISGMLVLTSLLVGFKVPLHASFLLARPGLEQALAEHCDDLAQVGRVHHDFGLYQIKKAYRGCHLQDRVFFQFRDDVEAAIIYSQSGIDDLCYNSGSKGHLFGDWYWMKED